MQLIQISKPEPVTSLGNAQWYLCIYSTKIGMMLQCDSSQCWNRVFVEIKNLDLLWKCKGPTVASTTLTRTVGGTVLPDQGFL